MVSDFSSGSIVVEVFAVAALPFANGLIILDQFNCFEPFDHLETELGFHPQAQWRSVIYRNWSSIHLVGQNSLGVLCFGNVQGTIVLATLLIHLMRMKNKI